MRFVALFGFAIAGAILITAATQEGRQTPAVVDSLSNGAVRLTEASLGQMPSHR